MILLQQMTVLFILMGIGLLCSRLKMITEEVNRKLSAIVVNIANPAMILTGCMGDERIEGKELMVTAMLAAAVYASLILLAVIIPAVLRIDRKNKGIYQVMTIFSNIGFMGFPLVSALYGSSAVLHASLFLIPYNILVYTFGVSAMSTKDKVSRKDSFSLKKVLNVGVTACIVTMIIYFLQIPVPGFIKETATYLSNLTAPLSMMVIGASLSSIDLKKLFTDRKLLTFSAIKLLVIPIFGVLLIRQIVDNDIICGVCLVMLATPVGSMTAMLAQQYEGDYETASEGVALTTILSVITIPIVFMLL